MWEKTNIKQKPKISKNAICHFLLLFAAFNPEITQERHLESKEVGSFIVSGYSINIFKLFLALKSTMETIGSKVPKRVFSVFVCGSLFFIQF
jgi:hypothetical protein